MEKRKFIGDIAIEVDSSKPHGDNMRLVLRLSQYVTQIPIGENMSGDVERMVTMLQDMLENASAQLYSDAMKMLNELDD